MVEDTRTRIITATNELFRRQGYNGTSLSQVSDAAAATTGSIYHFFPGGKEALAVAVINSTGSMYRQLFEMIVSDAPDPQTAFDSFFDGAAQVLVESDFIDPCPIGTIAREVASTNVAMRQAAEAAFDSWVKAATDYLTGAGVALRQASDLATLFVTTTEGCFILCRTKRSTEPLEAVARMVAPLVVLAIEQGVSANRSSADLHD